MGTCKRVTVLFESAVVIETDNSIKLGSCNSFPELALANPKAKAKL